MNKQWQKALVVAGLVLAVAVSGLLLTGNGDKEVIGVCEDFYTALMDGKPADAAELAEGMVAYNVSANAIDNKRYDILDMDSDVLNKTKGTAVVRTCVTFRNEKILNVVWYESQLYKGLDGWKIIGLSESEPELKDARFAKVDTAAIREVFDRYMGLVENKEFEPAANYLVGQARTMHEKTSDLLKGASLVKNMSDVSITVLHEGKQTAMCRMDYANDGKLVSVLTYCWLTQEGWKIYKVTQI